MAMVAAEKERLRNTALGNTRPVRYQYPNSTIEIVEIMEGELQGKFLFRLGAGANTKHSHKSFRPS